MVQADASSHVQQACSLIPLSHHCLTFCMYWGLLGLSWCGGCKGRVMAEVTLLQAHGRETWQALHAQSHTNKQFVTQCSI